MLYLVAGCEGLGKWFRPDNIEKNASNFKICPCQLYEDAPFFLIASPIPYTLY